MYGKTLQKAIFNSNMIINNLFEFNDFLLENELTDWIVLNDNKLLVSGEIKKENENDCIRKPAQLGAFVTAYSRRIMLHYIKAMDPTLTKLTFTYTDTDSLHILGEYHQKLLSMGYIKPKDASQLGYLCSDIKRKASYSLKRTFLQKVTVTHTLIMLVKFMLKINLQ